MGDECSNRLADVLNSETNKMKFSLGQVVATPGALEALADAGQTPEFFLESTSPEIGATSTPRTRTQMTEPS